MLAAGNLDELRREALARDGYLCTPCKTIGLLKPAIAARFVIEPRHGGRADDLGNLQSICRHCLERREGKRSATKARVR